jgi:hypothetical protein
LAICAGLVGGLLASSTALARDRLAVLMIADDPVLADNLVEVAISHLTTRGDWELVGQRELRGRLATILPEGGVGACAAEPRCLAALGDAAHADRVVIGGVQRNGDVFVVDLTLANPRTGDTEERFSATIPADEARLIAAIRGGIDQLFAVKSVAPAIAVIPVGDAAPRSLGRPSSLDLRREDEAPAVHRGSILPYVGWGSGAISVVSFSAAAVTGSFATAALSGTTRAERQADLQRRDDYATTANVLLGVGTAFAAVAVVALYQWWHGERGASPRAAP